MSWERPELLGLIPVAAILVLWAARTSQHPMSARRRVWLSLVRITLFGLAAAALAGPTTEVERTDEAVVFVLDHSRSQGRIGQAAGVARVESLIAALPPETKVGVVSTGQGLRLVRTPSPYPKETPLPVDPSLGRERRGPVEPLSGSGPGGRALPAQHRPPGGPRQRRAPDPRRPPSCRA